MSELINILAWYLALSIIGLTALPLAFRFFPRLPNRGYMLARPLGLLLWGFIFWLLTSLGVLQNDLGGEMLAFLLLAGLAIWGLSGGKKPELFDWFRQNKRTILTTEVLFLLVFTLWVFVRGMNPEVTYTEKPMELAFINSILRSTGFPPQDPWLSGYAISYYYFGYVMIAMLTRVSGVASAVGFNLSSASWLAMTAVGLFGIVYDITFVWARKRDALSSQEIVKFSRRAGFLGPLFVLLLSTVEGVLEFLHAGGVFWKAGEQGQLTSRFWTWLSILDLNQPPTQPFDWMPSRAGGWLWWRGSRVLQDLTLGGQHVEIIDEFPFFSYLLADMHPHVLAMPFTLLAIALSLNLFIGGETYLSKGRGLSDWLKNTNFWLTALVMGSLSFINTWDFPIYVGLYCLVWAFKRYHTEGWSAGILWEFLKNGLALGIAGLLLFLPFYIGFGSQAGGILPSLEFMTRGVHFWVLFAVLLVPLGAFSFYHAKSSLSWKGVRLGVKVVIILLGVLFALMLVYGSLLLSFQLWGPALMASTNPYLSALGVKMSQGGTALAGVHAGYPPIEILTQSLLRRLRSPGTWLTLGALLSINLGVLLKRREGPEINDEHAALETPGRDNVEIFVFILVLLGLLLTLFPEFFYLRDQFGTRMNTIFKFYFQAWILWGLSAAVGSAILFQQLRGWRAALFQIVWIMTLLAGLAYPILMLWDKTNAFSTKDWTLDGNAYIQKYNPDEYAAIEWLQQAPMGIITEAVGGSYTDYARVSTRSGLPTVLGWPGHESQWRGGGEEMGSRFSDLQVLYETSDWYDALRVLQSYNVRYIYVGNLERSTYRVKIEKFAANLATVFTNGSVTIYEVPAVDGAAGK